MSLIIETQFAALTVDEKGEISSKNDTNNNNNYLETTAGDDFVFNSGKSTAFNNMAALGDSLPPPHEGADGRSTRVPRWIKSCKFDNIPGTQPFRFRMRVDTKMSNLKRAFARVTGISDKVFWYNGREVGDYDTPQELGMENGFLLEII